MSQWQVGSFQWMKQLNKAAILNAIRLHGPIPRAEIAKLTKLTPPTVTNLVAELMEERLVVESALGESTGGRKPILLRINSAAFHVIGVYAGAKRILAVDANLDGQVMREVETKIPFSPSESVFLQLLRETVQKILEKSQTDGSTVLGIGIGMHGLVDPRRGLSLFAPNLKLENIAVKDFLEREFHLPVEVENDVRALALAESWFGQGRDTANFVCVNVGTGIGAAIVIDHQLYQGTSFTAGEIGHTTIDVNGPRCNCGNRGCLEVMAAGPALVRRAQLALHQGKPSLLGEWIQGKREELDGELIYRAAMNGDEVAISALAETGRYLGIGLANLINTLNPSLIILTGGVSRAGDFILNPLRETVQERALRAPRKAVTIVASRLGRNAAAVGGFTLILRKLFTPEGI